VRHGTRDNSLLAIGVAAGRICGSQHKGAKVFFPGRVAEQRRFSKKPQSRYLSVSHRNTPCSVSGYWQPTCERSHVQAKRSSRNPSEIVKTLEAAPLLQVRRMHCVKRHREAKQ